MRGKSRELTRKLEKGELVGGYLNEVNLNDANRYIVFRKLRTLQVFSSHCLRKANNTKA